MLELTKKQLRQLQFVQLELLMEVDRICKKCGIKYNIIAGTLLGAIRHGGYIPWDDDADVAFLRPEYEKFRKACKNELDRTKFYFQDHRNTKGYRWGYGKLRRKNTLFLREHQEHMPYQQGVFIDIFPLDGVPDNYFLRSIKNFECFCVRKLLWSKVGKSADSNFWICQIYKLLDRIPEHIIIRYYNNMIRNANQNKKQQQKAKTTKSKQQQQQKKTKQNNNNNNNKKKKTLRFHVTPFRIAEIKYSVDSIYW